MTDVDIIQGGVLKIDNTGPAFRAMLLDEDGNPVNLTGFDATLRVREPYADALKVDAAMTIFDAERGIVEYDWSATDTDEAAFYKAEIETTDGTDTISYPSDYYFRVHIIEDLT
jgi:hypothetical protein